jgi:hypothetical protein
MAFWNFKNTNFMRTKQKRKLNLSKKMIVKLSQTNFDKLVGGAKTSGYPTCQTNVRVTCRM